MKLKTGNENNIQTVVLVREKESCLSPLIARNTFNFRLVKYFSKKNIMTQIIKLKSRKFIKTEELTLSFF